MPKKDAKSLVMIVGMHRSGTSAVGRLLENIGFDFGSNLLEGIRSVNDDGFWEDKDVVALNEHIFELYGFRWFDFERMPGKWWEDNQIKNLVGVAETWYYESFSGEKPIAVKDPRFCRLLPFWKRVFQGLDLDLHVLFVYRHPIEVAASLKKRDGFPLQLGYLLWLSYTIDALYYSRNLSLSLLHYEELLEAPDKLIHRIFDVDLSHISLLSEVDKSSLVKNSIDPGRHHQKSEKLLAESLCHGDIQMLAVELYEELLTANAEMAKGLADKYRKRLYRLLDHNKEILVALQEETHSQVVNVRKLFQLGEDHTHALAVIREKDAQLEENKDFIKRCLDEIQNKEVLLKSAENPSSLANPGLVAESYVQRFDGWMADLNKLVDDYRCRLEEQKAYIQACEEKLSLQEKGLADNQEYIAKCHSRIAEQDVGIAENRGYITACEERIRVQDEGLVIRDGQLSDKDESIINLERNVARLQELLGTANADLLEKNQYLQSLTEQERAQKEKLEEGAASLAKCEARITQLDFEISKTQSDIYTCEERIRVQDESLEIRDGQLSEKNEKIISLEINIAQLMEQLEIAHADLLEKGQQIQLLMEQDDKQKARFEESAACIAQYQARILEQDAGMAESRGYITACEERIREQDEALGIRDGQLSEKSEQIKGMERNIAQLQGQLVTANTGLLEKGQQIQLLIEQERKQKLNIEENAAYISKQQTRISEQDVIISENRMCIANHEERIRLLDEDKLKMQTHIEHLNDSLQSAQTEASNKAEIIDRLEGLEAITRQRIALQKVQLEKIKAHAAAMESELIALRAEHAEWGRNIERYRSYRVVKVIEKLFPEAEK